MRTRLDESSSDSKVAQLDDTTPVKKDVWWLDITVHDLLQKDRFSAHGLFNFIRLTYVRGLQVVERFDDADAELSDDSFWNRLLDVNEKTVQARCHALHAHADVKLKTPKVS